jgi:hypothetical protein
MNDTSSMPDTERAACTILAHDAKRVIRRPLRDWTEQIVADPAFSANLDPAVAHLILNREPFAEHALRDGLRPSDLMLDEAIYRLADAVVEFRAAGRPAGARTSAIDPGLPGPPSLATRLSEYVAYLHQTYAIAMQEIEDAR